MKRLCLLLLICALSACSDAGQAPSLTFAGVGEPSLNVQESGSNDVATTPDIVVADAEEPECSTDDDCDGAIDGQCSVWVCTSQGTCEETWVDNGTDCDDGSECTEGESCLEGSCAGGENICPCESDDDCVGSSFDQCLGTWRCEADGCQLTPGTAVECEDSQEPCIEAVCIPETGSCEDVDAENGLPCDDGNACTEDSFCADGDCQGALETTVECNDDNECTADACDTEIGCVYEPIDGPCDDGDVCSLTEVCELGSCVAVESLECETDDQCMNAACDAAEGCIEIPKVDGTACDDGNACTEDDTCSAGGCSAGTSICECESDADCPDDSDLCNGTPTCINNACLVAPDTIPQCDDVSECMASKCVPATGQCEEEPIADGSPCDDGLGCTVSTKCKSGACAGTPKLCDDANPCTQDACDSNSGACVFSELAGPCEDGDPCTLSDTCENGICKSGALDDCVDGDACTNDACAEGIGCQWEPSDCDDGILCTVDTCLPESGCVNTAKTCEDADAQCVLAACSEASGECVDTVNEGAACEDGDPCTIGDTCINNACKAGENCDDGNPCTLDSCDGDGCINEPGPFGETCDDGDACTFNDQCASGLCQGVGIDCADDDPCTEQVCQAGECVYSAVPGCEQNVGCDQNSSGKPCNDGDASTFADVCVQGICRGFELQRINASKATGNIIYSDTDRALGRWFLTSSRTGGDSGTAHLIEQYDEVGVSPVKLKGSSAALPYNSIDNGFAVSADGILREFLGQDWSSDTPVAQALKDTGTAEATAVWVYRGQGETKIFVVGQDGDEPYIRECSWVDGWCNDQTLFMPNNYWFGDTRPKALTGRELCDAGECFPAVLLAGDAQSQQGYYNNVHYREPSDSNFYAWYGDWWSGGFQTGAAAAYGDGRYILNGPEGFVRYFDGGNWSNTLDDLKGGTQGLQFSDIWIGADVVVMVANYTISKDNYGAELWVGSRENDAYFNNTWSIYDLGEHKGANAGYFGISGGPDGEIRIVGSGIDTGAWQDGLILVRKP